MKAISHLVASTTTSASPVDTKVTGAVSATQEAVQVDRNSTPDTSKRIGPAGATATTERDGHGK